MELRLQSFENPILSLHVVSASKGYGHKHSEHLLGHPGEGSGLCKHRYRTNSCVLPSKNTCPFQSIGKVCVQDGSICSGFL